MNHTSIQPAEAIQAAAPAETAHSSMQTLNRFNWAAFLMPPVWLLGHRMWNGAAMWVGACYLTHSWNSLVSCGLFAIGYLVLGFSANQMLWETGRYESFSELNRKEKRWGIAAWVISILLAVMVLILFFSGDR